MGPAVAPLEILVPWRFILTVAFVNDVEDVQLGFAAENVTVLSQ